MVGIELEDESTYLIHHCGSSSDMFLGVRGKDTDCLIVMKLVHSIKIDNIDEN